MDALMKSVLVFLTVMVVVYEVKACNEAICAPLVSKCMLIKCCDCEMNDLKNCSCCRDCQVCLSKLYTECCSCVGLCPPPDPTDELTKSSSVEELPDPIPDLFNVLTEEEDYHKRWTTFTYAVDLDKLAFHPGTNMPDTGVKIITVGKTDDTQSTNEQSERILGIKNCTVAFFSDCMSMAKCKASCKSMGAAKYRWFHEHGCCQCVGSSCYDYGLSEPKCLLCPEVTDMEFSDHSYVNLVQKDAV
uniref:Protein twisted gastrulation n=1 Tax=Arion vulgaris TaxID=1028688 RepID=A0A0B7AEZ1_9EUPU